MKILHVIPYFAWSYGGPVRCVYELSQELTKKGHSVTIFSTDVGKRCRLAKNDHIQLQGVGIRYFKNISNFIANKFYLYLSPEMRLAIKNEIMKYDIVHLDEYGSTQNIYVWYYARKYGIPYVLETYGSFGVRPNDPIKKIYNWIFGRRLVRDASMVIAMTPAEVKQFKKLGINESKITEIPNSLNLDDYNSLPKEGHFREEYQIKEKNIILFVGRVTKDKGIDLLTTAFANLLKLVPDARLVIIGPDFGGLDYLKHMIQRLGIGNNVTITGFVPHEMKCAAYVDASVYVLPSYYECFPTTVLEACVCGTPIIVSESCQIAHWVNNNVGLASPHDENKLCDTIYNIITNRELEKKFKDNGKQLIRDKYSVFHCTSRTLEVYQEVLRERR